MSRSKITQKLMETIGTLGEAADAVKVVADPTIATKKPEEPVSSAKLDIPVKTYTGASKVESIIDPSKYAPKVHRNFTFAEALQAAENAATTKKDTFTTETPGTPGTPGTIDRTKVDVNCHRSESFNPSDAQDQKCSSSFEAPETFIEKRDSLVQDAKTCLGVIVARELNKVEAQAIGVDAVQSAVYKLADDLVAFQGSHGKEVGFAERVTDSINNTMDEIHNMLQLERKDIVVKILEGMTSCYPEGYETLSAEDRTAFEHSRNEMLKALKWYRAADQHTDLSAGIASQALRRAIALWPKWKENERYTRLANQILLTEAQGVLDTEVVNN